MEPLDAAEGPSWLLVEVEAADGGNDGHFADDDDEEDDAAEEEEEDDDDDEASDEDGRPLQPRLRRAAAAFGSQKRSSLRDEAARSMWRTAPPHRSNTQCMWKRAAPARGREWARGGVRVAIGLSGLGSGSGVSGA